MFYPAFVCLSVCYQLHVKLLIRSSDLRKHFTEDESLEWDKEDIIKFWKSSAFGSGSGTSFE